MFHHGLAGPAQNGTNIAQLERSLPSIPVGYFDELQAGKTCPSCRLLCRLVLENYLHDSFTSPTIERTRVECALTTIESVKLGELSVPGTGPPAWYIWILASCNGEALEPHSQRYLVPDARDMALAACDWVDNHSPFLREANQHKHVGEDAAGIIAPAVPRPNNLPKQYFYSGRRAGQGQADFRLLTRWIRFCDENHDCSNYSFERHKPSTKLPLKVVDVRTRTIVRTPPNCRFIALSYVWGVGSHFRTSKLSESIHRVLFPRRLPPLPGTIEDAITAVKRLNERYLWVDSLCINQNDPEEKATQIKLMERIYGGAYLTLVAAEGCHSDAGLLGVKGGSRDQYKQYAEIVKGMKVYISFPLLREALSLSPVLFSRTAPSGPSPDDGRWISRGWTYQEGILSTRCLVFTRYQVFWQCRQEHCCETLAEPLDHQRLSSSGATYEELLCTTHLHTMEEMPSLKSYFGTHSYYFKLVQAFSKRLLTYDSDRLDALTGILTAFGRRDGSTFFWGLPEDIFDLALSWMPRNCTRAKNRPSKFPSWSWASFPGAVTHFAYDSEKSTIKNVRQENIYYKLKTDGKIENIWQKQVGYNEETLRRENMRDERILHHDEEADVTEAYFEDIPDRYPPPEKTFLIFGSCNLLKAATVLPLIYFYASLIRLRVYPISTVHNVGVCTGDHALRIEPLDCDFSSEFHSKAHYDLSLDYASDMPRVTGQTFHLILMSSLGHRREVLAIMLIEKHGQSSTLVFSHEPTHISNRLGFGLMHPGIWQLCQPRVELVLLG
jgi:hypothetical protein